MMGLKWGNAEVLITESSTARVAEQLMGSHLHMVKGAMRSTRQPMVVWVSDLDLETFKRNPEVSKEFCARMSESGNFSTRGFHFLAYQGRHFALSPSVQALEVDEDTTFEIGQELGWIRVKIGSETKMAILASPLEGLGQPMGN
jgi:hypothetical protein